jgi:hypothetical protein
MDASVEQLTETFQCAVCYELISSRHKSRVLPCGHGNVCEKDLAALWKQAQQGGQRFKCPSQGCNLPDCPPVDALPVNWAFISAGDAFEDFLSARESSSSILSGPAKRAMQLVISASDPSLVAAANVIRIANDVYCLLTQSYSSPEDDCGRKVKLSDASSRYLQEAESRIVVLKKIMAGHSVAMVFMKLCVRLIRAVLLPAHHPSSASSSRAKETCSTGSRMLCSTTSLKHRTSLHAAKASRWTCVFYGQRAVELLLHSKQNWTTRGTACR